MSIYVPDAKKIQGQDQYLDIGVDGRPGDDPCGVWACLAQCTGWGRNELLTIWGLESCYWLGQQRVLLVHHLKTLSVVGSVWQVHCANVLGMCSSNIRP
jgi:hypothetical protein